LGRNGSKCAAEFDERFWDGSLEEAGVFIDKVCKAVVIEGGADLLDHHGPLDEVASVENCCQFGKEAMGLGDLSGCCVGKIWKHVKDWTNKGHS
jgi:hypothetical protein